MTTTSKITPEPHSGLAPWNTPQDDDEAVLKSVAPETEPDFDYPQFVREHVIEADISYRGGTLKVDASELFPSLDGPAIVGAYQNYLGGGIAGSIIGAAMFGPDELDEDDREIFPLILEACQRHFHELNNGGGDEYMQENYNSYEFNQSLPESAY